MSATQQQVLKILSTNLLLEAAEEALEWAMLVLALDPTGAVFAHVTLHIFLFHLKNGGKDTE